VASDSTTSLRDLHHSNGGSGSKFQVLEIVASWVHLLRQANCRFSDVLGLEPVRNPLSK
jgi:hypothetical protein